MTKTIKVVLVHGGGPEINAMLKKINKQSEFVNGLRYTDEETIDIVQMVLAGKVNKDLVQLLQRAGGKAMGLCSLDGDLIKAKQLNPDLGFVGDITEIDPDPINTALNNGYIPVVSTVASGKNGEVFNINADTAAARMDSTIFVGTGSGSEPILEKRSAIVCKRFTSLSISVNREGSISFVRKYSTQAISEDIGVPNW